MGPAIKRPAPDKRQQQQAEDAYLEGAKKLRKNDLSGAERDFERALQLDPGNRDYASAVLVVRQQQITELVRQASQAKLAGHLAKAQKLLAQAQAIDPHNPMVIEHSGPALETGSGTTGSGTTGPGATELGTVGLSATGSGTAGPSIAASPEAASVQAAEGSDNEAGIAQSGALAERARMLAGYQDDEPWKIQTPVLAAPIRLTPSDAVKSFHINGTATDVIRDVMKAYGIRAVIDNSVTRRFMRFDLEKVDYAQAMRALTKMTDTFTVPIDESSALVAKDTAGNRASMERQVQETVFVPGATVQQINELTTLARSIFKVGQANVDTANGTIVLRAPEGILGPLNRTLQDLIDSSGEVVVDVKMYAIDTSRKTNGGASIPTQAGMYNVQQAAAALVTANEGLVQQAIAQGLVSATASNLVIAGELIASGLVQSSLLSSTVGVIGGGSTLTGITETGNIGFNMGVNSSNARVFDDVQLRVGDNQTATFREGTRYPIMTSTYSSGISSAASALGNASINGVSVASLLSKYAGGSSMTIPQVTYEDLGVTLTAKPSIQKAGRVNLKLGLKILALSGSSSDGNPILANREFDSDITVKEGESVLMVSNMSRTETAALAGIPGLSELPGFQMPISANIQQATDQVVMVVTPHIVRRRSDLFIGPQMLVPIKVGD